MTMEKMLVAMLCVCFLALSATACDVENFDDAGDTLAARHNTTDRGMFTVGIKQAVDEAPTIIESEENDEK